MKLLSYPVAKTTPMYGGGPGPEIETDKCMHSGDSCNTLNLTISNHTGTHLDCPYHFDHAGRRLTDYEASFWYCSPVATITIPTPPPRTLIAPEHVAEFIEGGNQPLEAEALIMKTGYCDMREEPVYTAEPPGIHASMADYLRNQFPHLKFFAFDLISISSFANREHGRESHRRFLQHERPILPVEDMDLRDLPAEGIRNLLISPLWIADADGSPCSIWANVPVRA